MNRLALMPILALLSLVAAAVVAIISYPGLVFLVLVGAAIVFAILSLRE